jgi:hypothetical protein
MKKNTINDDIFGDHVTGKLHDAGTVTHWNKLMASAFGKTGTVNPTHGMVTDRTRAPGQATSPAANRAVRNAPLDSLKSVPVAGERPGVTAETLAQRARNLHNKKRIG